MSRHAWILLVGLVACGGGEAPADAPKTEDAAPAKKDASPEGVARVAKEIKADPGKQGEILEANGWTAADFEKALWEIAEDPVKAAAYRKALGG